MYIQKIVIISTRTLTLEMYIQKIVIISTRTLTFEMYIQNRTVKNIASCMIKHKKKEKTVGLQKMAIKYFKTFYINNLVCPIKSDIGKRLYS